MIDNYKGGYTAMAYLMELGCRRIAHITSPLSRNVYARRFEGYRQDLKDHGLPHDARLLVVSD